MTGTAVWRHTGCGRRRTRCGRRSSGPSSDGFTHFISGFAEGADLLFAQLVVEYRHQYPLTLEAAIPYPARLQNRDPRFQALLAQCDAVQVHSPQYFRGCL